ncbi:MAG: chemotaxis protein CheW [Candidatus Odinarchaeota archaeon]
MSHEQPDRIEIGRIGIGIEEIKDDLKAVKFTLDDSTFGVDVSQVTEVCTAKRITAVPNAPEHVVGVINLRGQILTVIDLKYRLAIGRTRYDSDGPGGLNILIIEIGEKKLGMAVDTVSNVITIPLSKIETKIDLVSNIRSSFLRGVGKISSLTVRAEEDGEEDEEEELVVLLNLNAILTEYEAGELAGMQRSLTEQVTFERAAEEIGLTEEDLRRLDLISADEDIEKMTTVEKTTEKVKKVEAEKGKSEKKKVTRAKTGKEEPEKIKIVEARPEKDKLEKGEPEKVKTGKIKTAEVKSDKVKLDTGKSVKVKTGKGKHSKDESDKGKLAKTKLDKNKTGKIELEEVEPVKTGPKKTGIFKRLLKR